MSKNQSIVFTKLNKDDNGNKIWEFVSQLAILTVLTIGCLGLLFGTINYREINVGDVIFACIIVLFFILIFDWLSVRGKIIFFFLYIAGIATADFILREQFVRGYQYFFNQISKMLGNTYGRIFPIYTLSGEYGGGHIIYAFTVTVIAASALMFYFIIRYENTMAGILLMISAIFFQAFYGNEKQVFFFAIFIIGNLTFIRKRTVADGAVSAQKNLSGFIIVLAVISVIIGIAGMNFSATNSDSINYLHKKAEDIIEKIRYEKEGEVALEVTMSQPESYYLRGFVGSRLGDYGWKETAHSEIYKYADLFYWLHQANFYGENQLALAAEIFQKETDTQNKNEESLMENINKIQIKNVGASAKYIYAPYEYLCDSGKTSNRQLLPDERRIGDERFQAEGIHGTDEYTFQALSNQVSKYPEILSNINNVTTDAAKTYLAQESFYSEYVYQTYTEIETEAEEILEAHLGRYEQESDVHISYRAAKENILNYLSENIDYTEQTATKISKGDFLEMFLEVNCQGDAKCYATAAVLMFRYYGIPARYVEGYLITPDDVEGIEANETIKIPLTNAHSWAEYYQDGVGWIPFEAAPPYLDLMEKADEIYGTSAGSSSKSESGIEEIVEDNYEDNSSEPEKNKDIRIPKQVIIAVLILLAVLWMGIFIVRYLIQKKKYNALIHSGDNNIAIRAMFSDMMKNFFEYKLEEKNCSLMEYGQEITQLEKNCNMGYKSAVDLYQRSRYSSCTCTDREREEIYVYVKEMKRNIYDSLNLRQKLKWRIHTFF